MSAAAARIASLGQLSAAEAACTRCPLYRNATQAVPGEGPSRAALMLVGEQPGDQEDLAGHPFVGPAGRVLDRALGEAGVDRTSTFVTNAVKHFKFELRGKRRLHKKPNAAEIDACRLWFEFEQKLIKPRVVVALGASAARSVLGRTVAIKDVRGSPLSLPNDLYGVVTVHPSALLRQPDRDEREREFGAFVADLRLAASLVG